ncbi:MAG: ABC-type cobalamin/Fe3+-siderophores transport system, ATPase component [Cyanobacteria bacterium RYN_339]|nr:ABC-type cobalamin/Fe3+-siderophores transport system, ATPase component [Cyanobacteria bacterium RYN_339]
MTLLSASRLACGYDGRPVVTEATLAVAPGELVGIVGPNGAGKSTLLKTLAGLLPTLGGQIAVQGKPLAAYRAAELAKLRAYMPQSLPADEGWTVREVVRMGRFPHQRGWGLVEAGADRAAIADALAATGLTTIQDQRVDRLSGGQRQRAYLARALAQDAPLLMLDEPTAHLDLGHQLEFFKLVRAATQERGVAAVAVLHDLNLAAQFCHRLWVVEAGDDAAPGGILADGRPEAVLVPELIQRAFGLAVQVRHHPDTGLPYLLPVDGIERQIAGRWAAVHVIAGGGSGVRLIPTLHRLGFAVSVGVVNLLDSDHTLAARLGLPCVVEAPFSPVGPPARQQLAARLAAAAHVIVGDVAWGSGNLANLEALADLPPDKLWLVEPSDGAGRDFTDGTATRLRAHLLAHGAHALELDALLDHFRGIIGSP